MIGIAVIIRVCEIHKILNFFSSARVRRDAHARGRTRRRHVAIKSKKEVIANLAENHFYVSRMLVVCTRMLVVCTRV